jgi:hypothetical protein
MDRIIPPRRRNALRIPAAASQPEDEQTDPCDGTPNHENSVDEYMTLRGGEWMRPTLSRRDALQFPPAQKRESSNGGHNTHDESNRAMRLRCYLRRQAQCQTNGFLGPRAVLSSPPSKRVPKNAKNAIGRSKLSSSPQGHQWHAKLTTKA